MSQDGSESQPGDAPKLRAMLSRAGSAAVRLANGVTAVVAAIGAVLALVLAVGGPDKVPKPVGATAASSDPTPAYQRDVGRVCDTLNADARTLARRNGSLARRIARAATTVEQRRVLLDDQRRLVGRASDAIARFRFLAAPPSRRKLHARTVAAWADNVARMRTYAQRLDGVRDRDDLLRAIDYLAASRPLVGADGEIVMAGLLSLGGSHCDLEGARIARSVSLPAVGESGAAGGAPTRGNITPLGPNIVPPAVDEGSASWGPPARLGSEQGDGQGASSIEEE